MSALRIGPVAALWCSTLAFAAALAWNTTVVDAQPAGSAAAREPAGQPAGDYVGEQTCVSCHTEQRVAGAHARRQDSRAPAAAQGCETCHGPGRAHAESGDPARIRAYTTLAARDASATCTSCHNRGTHALWSGSMHDARSVSCVSCHSVHNPKSEGGQLRKASQGEICAQCHKPQALKVQRSSHMPVREGKMECTSCHNPHGSTNVKMLKVGNWVNESCGSCHAEKRGPFLWEHAAGRESCISCHDPHGSSNDRMLVAKLPMLCQRCHIGTRHPSTIYDNSLRQTSNRLYGRSCVNCHQNIHGSNHPAGATLVR